MNTFSVASSSEPFLAASREDAVVCQSQLLSKKAWLQLFSRAAIEFYSHSYREEDAVVYSNGVTPPISAFLYAGSGAFIWSDIVSSNLPAQSARDGSNEIAFLKNEIQSIARKISPQTLIEYGSGSETALMNKTAQFLNKLSPTNYISLDLSPDFVKLPPAMLGGNFAGVNNVLSVQSDFMQNVSLAGSPLSQEIEGTDVLMLSLGSSFCNLPVVQPSGFPANGYRTLFDEYAKLGQSLNASNVYFYISYFRAASEDSVRAQYESAQTAKWFENLPKLIQSELSPRGSAAYDANAFKFNLRAEPDRDLLIGELVSQKNQGFAVSNLATGKTQKVFVRKGDHFAINLHYSPRPEQWVAIAQQAGWEPVRVKTAGENNGILLKLTR